MTMRTFMNGCTHTQRLAENRKLPLAITGANTETIRFNCNAVNEKSSITNFKSHRQNLSLSGHSCSRFL